MDEGRVEVVVEDRVATLWLDRPTRGNALSPTMMRALVEPLRTLDPSRVRAVLLRGRGRHFCAGYDLGALSALADADDVGEGDAAISELMAVLDALASCPVPTVAALDGACIGGGVLVASFCDLRVATASARLSIPAARLGMMYPLRGVERLVALVGPPTATRWLLDGGEITLKDAALAGFLTVEEERGGSAWATALAIAARAPLAVAGLLQTLRGLVSGEDRAVLRRTHAGAMALCLASADLREGLVAHAERRTPMFEGR